MDSRQNAIFRFALVFLLIAAGFMAVLAYIIRIQWFERDKWMQMVDTQKPNATIITPQRGNILDAEGRLLGFFYTRVAEGSDVRRKRVGLRKLIQPYLRYEVDAAIAVFDDGPRERQLPQALPASCVVYPEARDRKTATLPPWLL